MNVVRAVENTQTSAGDRPLQDVVIANTRVEENVQEAPVTLDAAEN
jgi:hypothetical protein